MAPPKASLKPNLSPNLGIDMVDDDKPAPKAADKNARVKIVLEDNDFIPPTGLFVGYNGKTFMIRTGVEVSVPPGVIDILDHAVMSVPVKDPYSLQVVGQRERNRYPYKRVA